MVQQISGVVARHVLPVALERIADDPVLLLEGPRTVGKSTLLRQLAEARSAILLDLDDPATREAVAADPALFVSAPGTVCVDEYQRAPVVLDAIKAELNRDSRPGRFVLAGSARHDSLPQVAQALTGRLSRLTVYPLSQGELMGTRGELVASLFEDPVKVVAAEPISTTTREEYIERLVAGGFPMALARRPSSRGRWFDDYVALTLERDVRELSRVRQGAVLRALLSRLASQTAQVLNIDAVARDLGMDHTTAESYTRLLEAVFLVFRLPAWGKALGSRTAARPKLHVLDSGVAARLGRLSAERLGRRDPTALTELGHLLETFVVGELMKSASWLDRVAVVGHWRTHDDDEVDLVVERDDGTIVAFEVKAAGRVSGDDLGPLRKLRARTGERFVAGVVLYTGQRSYSYESRLHVLPIECIWKSR